MLHLMQVAIALGLLVAEMTRLPFDGLVCTFSQKPQLHRITGTSLQDQVFTILR